MAQAPHKRSSQLGPLSALTVDPLQALVVIVSLPDFVFMTDVGQDHHIF
jgi:hypothetical protein